MAAQQAQPRQATQNEVRAADLINDLWNDPALGAAIRQRAKAKFADIAIPEETLSPIVAPLAKQVQDLRAANEELQKRWLERETKDAETAAFNEMQAKVDGAVSRFSLTDEGRQKMLDRMKETGNYADPDAAAAFIAHTAPKPAALPSWANSHMNLFGSKEYDESMAKLHRNPEAYLDDELNRFASNPDRYVAETFGA